MSNLKHPNGYLPKIAYHIASDNQESIAHFFECQVKTYGPITAEDMSFIANESARIQRMWRQEESEFNSHLSIQSYNL